MKQYNIRVTHVTAIVYLKQRQVDMLSLVFKKLNLCPVMPASRGVNPLATSHTVEHLSSICLHNRNYDKLILYFLSHCLNKIDIVWNPDNNQNFILQYCKKKSNSLQALSCRCNITRCDLKIYMQCHLGEKTVKLQSVKALLLLT